MGASRNIQGHEPTSNHNQHKVQESASFRQLVWQQCLSDTWFSDHKAGGDDSHLTDTGGNVILVPTCITVFTSEESTTFSGHYHLASREKDFHQLVQLRILGFSHFRPFLWVNLLHPSCSFFLFLLPVFFQSTKPVWVLRNFHLFFIGQCPKVFIVMLLLPVLKSRAGCLCAPLQKLLLTLCGCCRVSTMGRGACGVLGVHMV